LHDAYQERRKAEKAEYRAALEQARQRQHSQQADSWARLAEPTHSEGGK
jgi:hypothetical protein